MVVVEVVIDVLDEELVLVLVVVVLELVLVVVVEELVEVELVEVNPPVCSLYPKDGFMPPTVSNRMLLDRSNSPGFLRKLVVLSCTPDEKSVTSIACSCAMSCLFGIIVTCQSLVL